MCACVTALDPAEVQVPCAETLFYGLCGVRALVRFLFIFVNSLLMCLTKGQTLVKRGVGQLVTLFLLWPQRSAFLFFLFP